MEPFEYASPTSRKEVVGLLGTDWQEAQLLAGGVDIISLMKDYVEKPRRVVSLHQVADLRGIESSGRELRIGSMVTIREVMENETIKRHYPILAQFADYIRSEQLRNMGTAGGNLLQRPRCWYYRLGYGLLAEQDGKPLVPNGDNRYHAILGNSGPAYFVSPSTMAPALIAMDARLRIEGQHGAREISVEKLYTAPTQSEEREHTIKPNEILTEIIVPRQTGSRSAYYEVKQRQCLDWPLTGAAVVLHMNGTTVRRARVVLSQVAPVPWPSPEAEQELEGKTVTEEVADAAGKAAVSRATPLSMNGYKVQLTRVAVKRAILQASQGVA
ncbi:MAG TPA: FAD binding domain-containing protein [Terriglobia bacterium]|nr:FAD binding domain-containing protein [Terriglobia bacterium]